ncbi:MAG: ATP-binding cassette domain-containing protein [Lachnospiraceae bacterium]|nr:ATP-binding cassette domain-containing protein [Lachnospiraceae bacterium]
MDKQTKKKVVAWIKGTAAVVFWILIWQLIVFSLEKKSETSMGGYLLVASPLETVKTFFVLIKTPEFWKAVGYSFAKIASGFFLALCAGVGCAVLASVSGIVKALLNPVLRLIKAVPVASFIILALFWLSSSKNLSVLISFLMVLPVIYTNVLQGIESTDKELLEMATVFRIPFRKRIRYIYIPAVLPYFVSACSVGLGFCFKSGIAAEIIGLPANSIGERLYEAKLYLLTEELFAWTAVIVLVSVIFEKAVMLLVKALAKGLAGYGKETGSAGDTGENETAESGVATEAVTEPAEGNGKTILPEEAEGTLAPTLQDALTGMKEKSPVNVAQSGYGLFEVTKRFEEKTVLEQFSLTIAPGETVALMGASGCGKSTAGKILLGLLKEDAGEVKRPKRLGAVFQEDRLCKEFDAITNIAMVTGDGQGAEAALKEVGLAGSETKPVAALSGGMKRRVAIVRALLSDGEVLVLDEPFTGLDATNRQKMMSYVKEKTRGRSVLLITHNAEEAERLADRVIRLS